TIVYAGVDYEPILRRAEGEADLILWDGGNNDLPFYRSDLHLVVADPHRPGHELGYYPGEANFRMADAIVISKTDSAPEAAVRSIEENAAHANPRAPVIRGALALLAPGAERLRGRPTLVIEDGPTVTHGGLNTGAGSIVAASNGADILDARRFAVGSIAKVYEQYPHLTRILPAMGYGATQIRELEETIRRSKAEFVVDGSPVDLQRLMRVDIPILNVRYEFDDRSGGLTKLLEDAERRLFQPRVR
ncbi:MAG: GTPase, partial [Thermoplasmata archaeon]|nr:GTPase [Thermoplasmata archaeon]